MSTYREAVLNLIRSRGLLRPKDLRSQGLPPVTLTRMVRSGELVRVQRGLYALPGEPGASAIHSALEKVAAKYPRVVVCLLSALKFHEIATRTPSEEIWVAISGKSRAPQVEGPPLQIVRYSGETMADGVEEHAINNISINVTSVARTIADCFKYRRKVGIDVAMEALREAWTTQRVWMDDLWHQAKLCRVANVMRPYMESLEGIS